MLPLSKIMFSNRQHRAASFQFRCGVLPLKVEAGRFQDIPAEYILCTMCEENAIETESHFLLYCSKYNQLRYQLFTNLNGLFTLYLNLVAVMTNLSSLY